MTAANISQAEWAEHVELEGRLMGSTARLERVTSTLATQVHELTEQMRHLNGNLEDLEEVTGRHDREKLVAVAIRKRNRAFMRAVGWLIVTGAAATEIAARIGWIK